MSSAIVTVVHTFRVLIVGQFVSTYNVGSYIHVVPVYGILPPKTANLSRDADLIPSSLDTDGCVKGVAQYIKITYLFFPR